MTSLYLRSTFSSLREYLTPITHKSTFAETGEITPEEFVAAGDHLVDKFPTWQWSPAPESKKRDFLPDDKQFLVTRHVPSYVRAADYEDPEGFDDAGSSEGQLNIDNEVDEDGWTDTHTKHPLRKHCTPEDERRHSLRYEEMIEGGSRKNSSTSSSLQHSTGSIEAEEEINDIDDLIDENAEEIASLPENLEKDEIVNDPKKRSYDLYITYSTSYRVPKMYLVGFDSNGTPLTPNQMFEDIASDYRQKTVTIEKAPFLSNTTSVSIHPCRHATVMKVLMKRAIMAAKSKLEKQSKDLVKGISKLGLAENQGNPTNQSQDDEDDWEAVDQGHIPEGGETEEEEIIRADQYLIIFLKFIASVTPGIEHDYTMDAF